MSRVPFPLQENERFCQWLETGDDYRYYNPMWFSSNYGYTISVYRNNFKVLKTNLKVGGRKHGTETRWTDYVKHICKRWESDKDKRYDPQYYYYINSYPKSHGLTKKDKQVIVQKAIALYHLTDGYLVLDDRYVVHHRCPFDWCRAAQYSNRASNLQCLLEDLTTIVSEQPEKRQHSFVHNVARETSPDKILTLMEKASDPDVPRFFFLPGELDEFFVKESRRNSDAAIGISMKNDDGSSYMNVYCMGADVKPIEE